MRRIVRVRATAVTPAALALLALAAPAPARAVALPFPCGSTWYASTHDDHRPSELAADFNRPSGSAGGAVLAGVRGIVHRHPFQARGYGRRVTVTAGNGRTTVYAHLARPVLVREGERVWRGTRIGTVGASGASDGPHLHYEQRVDGVIRRPVFAGAPVALPWLLPGTPLISTNCGQARRARK